MKLPVAALILAFCGNALADAWGVAKGMDGAVIVNLDRTDASGAATLTDAQLAEHPEVAEIAFEQSVWVGTIALTNRTLKFTGNGITLKTDGKASPFRLSGGDWTFAGLTFEGPGALPDKAHYYGGAIDCLGGTLVVTNCTFTNLVSRFNGGAISARLMDGDVAIADSTLADNRCGPINGTGGAIYASAAIGATVTLNLRGSSFRGNSAQSGGAVTTVCTTYDEEDPVRLDVRDCTFDGNTVNFSGGAAFVGGDASVSNTLFSANGADVQGGAICTSAIAVDAPEGPALQIRSGTVFRGNCATNDSVWTCGGAVALWGEGATLDVDGRHVVFAGNEAKSEKGAYGGAVYAAAGTTARLSLAQFLGNESETGGGAVFADAAGLVIMTSIFSNNTVTAAEGYGGAVSAEKATLTLSNSTVRYSNLGAVDVYDAAAEIVNCVIVDNGEASDVRIDGDASLVIRYSAFGTLEAGDGARNRITASDCLPKMDASVYRGGSLSLNSSGTNPVVVKGLPQSDEDHVKVRYGYDGRGYAMGAFESPTPSYLITYVLDDGKGDNRGVNNPANRYGFFADELPVTIYPPTRPCYEFLGWKEGDTYYWANDGFPKIPLGANRAYAFTALWQEKDKPFDTIHYVFEPGECEPDPEVVNNPDNPHHYVMSDTPFALYPPTKPGKALDGWQWRKEGDGFVALSGSVVPEGTFGDIWLRPVWTDAYAIEYDLSGGRNHPQNPVVYSQKTLPLAAETDPFAPPASGKVYAPTREGYEFTGWQWKKGAEADWKAFAETSPIPVGTTGDLTLKATWSPIQNTIEYDLGGGKNDPSNPTSYTVETDFPIVLKPATRDGLVFVGWQIRNFATQTWDLLEGGMLPIGTTGYVWVKATWTDKPTISVEELTWYHNRSDGRYYPKIVLKVDDGNASVVTGITFTCNGVSFEMPTNKLDVLKGLAQGETVTNGVENFVEYSPSAANYGFVPPMERLFEGFANPQRPDPTNLSVSVSGVFKTVNGETPLDPLVRLATVNRKSVRSLPAWVPVPAQFADFQVGERLSGRADVPAGAAVTLYGCANLGGEWVKVTPLSVGADGMFSTAVPKGLHFFKLAAEVRR